MLQFAEYASSWLEELLNRPFTYKARTEYYKGTASQKLPLRARPVYPAPTDGNPALSVYEDTGANWGTSLGSFAASTLLLYGTDYALDIDQEEGASRSAILYRLNRFWPRPTIRRTGLLFPHQGPDTGSIKVVYTAGFTADTLPGQLRLAANTLVARLLYLFPVGMEMGSESYEDRNINVTTSQKDYVLGPVRNMIWPYRNFKF